jgi:hypothetical protein
MEATDYSGMFVYQDGHIDHVKTSEGRTPSSGLSQATDYDPFGLEIPVYGVNDNQIKYNSKKLQPMPNRTGTTTGKGSMTR